MNRDEPFYREFLTELKSLDDFLLQRHGDIEYVERADPDVRRIMEAMAYFSARSRKLAVDGFAGALVRLARGHLDDLLHPQPARALVRAEPDGRLAEPVLLPENSQLRVTVATGPDAGTVGLVTTMCPMTVLPVNVHKARVGLRPGSGYRILIELRASAPIPNLDRPIPIHINYLGDYQASRHFLYAVEQHLESMSVFFGSDEPDAAAQGQRCVVRFGAHPRRDIDTHPHPLGDLSTFFHFPERDLYLHVDLPSQERPWRRAWLCLDMDADWPAELVVNKDIFALFVIPVENARTDLAEPIVCDGTRDGYSLRPPAPYQNDSLHSLAGVYQESESGWEPLHPEHLAPVLPEGTGTYEIETVAPGSEARLLLRIPDAFLAPRKVSVDARWYQPWFESRAVGRVDVTPQTRHVDGVRWHMQGKWRGHRPSRIQEKPFEILHLLALMGRPVLSRDEIVYVLRVLGADASSIHEDIVKLVRAVQVNEQRMRDGSIRYLYQLRLDKSEEEQAALVHDLIGKIERLLDAWSSSQVSVAAEQDKAEARAAPPR